MQLTNPFKSVMPYLLSGTILMTMALNSCSHKTVGNRGYDYDKTEEVTPNADDSPFNRSPGQMVDFKANYTLSNQDSLDVPTEVMPLWQQLQRLKRSNTILGSVLSEFSAENKIYYGFAPMENSAALWYPHAGYVQVSSDTTFSDAYRLMCLTHETIHGVQELNGVFKENMSWSIWDFQKSLLMAEAAAQVGEHLLALEFYRDSIPHLINCNNNFSNYDRKRLITAFNAAAADTLPYTKDLENIGVSEVYNMFKQQWWLNYYNGRVLESFALALKMGGLDAPSNDGAYSLTTARKTGYISEDFNYTAGLDSIPAKTFGYNSDMRDAFAYMECQRRRVTCGEKDPRYTTFRDSLHTTGNKYINVNFDAAFTEFHSFDNKKDFLDILNATVEAQKNVVPTLIRIVSPLRP